MQDTEDPLAHSGPRPSRSLSEWVLGMIERCGTREEKQVVAPHQGLLQTFLDHPDVLRPPRCNVLDIGLENAPVLKFNLISNPRGSPRAMIDCLATLAPGLGRVAEEVLRHRLSCHAGIKLSLTGVEYELYPYETPDGLLTRGVFADRQTHMAGLPASPYCFGYTATGGLSAYAELLDVPAEDLAEVTGFSLPVEGLRRKALFHSRQDSEGHWRPGKAGLEFLPFPSHLLNAALVRLDLRFAYLLHRGGARPYGVIGVHGHRQVFYTPLLPRSAKVR